jgi:mRNA interferase HigB
MRIITKSHITRASLRFPDAKKALESWYQLMLQNEFNNFAELKQVFGSVDPVGRTVVFDIKGNHYRLIAAIHYNKKTVYLLEVMDHVEYDRGYWKKKFKVHD